MGIEVFISVEQVSKPTETWPKLPASAWIRVNKARWQLAPRNCESSCCEPERLYHAYDRSDRNNPQDRPRIGIQAFLTLKNTVMQFIVAVVWRDT
jgi:hypothetical protein